MTAHLLLPEAANRRSYIVGATPQSEFGIDFPFFKTTAINVTVDGALVGIASVTGIGSTIGGWSSGLVQLEDEVSNATVVVYEDRARERVTDFSLVGPFDVNGLNTQLDYLTGLVQAQHTELGRCVRLAVGDPREGSAFELAAPSAQSDVYLTLDSDGNLAYASILPDGSPLTRAIVGAASNPQTAREAAAGVIPADTAWPEGHFLRHVPVAYQAAMQNGTSTLDAWVYINNWLAAIAGSVGYFPAGLVVETSAGNTGDRDTCELHIIQDDTTIYWGGLIRYNNKLTTGAAVNHGVDSLEFLLCTVPTGTRRGVVQIYGDRVTIYGGGTPGLNGGIDVNHRNSPSPGDVGEDLISGLELGRGSNCYDGPLIHLNETNIFGFTVHDVYQDGIGAFNSDTNYLTLTDYDCRTTGDVQGWTAATAAGAQGVSFSGGTHIHCQNIRIRGALDDAIAFHTRCKNFSLIGFDVTTFGGRVLISNSEEGIVANGRIVCTDDGVLPSTKVSFMIRVAREGQSNSEAAQCRNLLISNVQMYISGTTQIGSAAIDLVECGNGVQVRDCTVYAETPQNTAVGCLLKTTAEDLEGAGTYVNATSFSMDTDKSNRIKVNERLELSSTLGGYEIKGYCSSVSYDGGSDKTTWVFVPDYGEPTFTNQPDIEVHAIKGCRNTNVSGCTFTNLVSGVQLSGHSGGSAANDTKQSLDTMVDLFAGTLIHNNTMVNGTGDAWKISSVPSDRRQPLFGRNYAVNCTNIYNSNHIYLREDAYDRLEAFFGTTSGTSEVMLGKADGFAEFVLPANGRLVGIERRISAVPNANGLTITTMATVPAVYASALTFTITGNQGRTQGKFIAARVIRLDSTTGAYSIEATVDSAVYDSATDLTTVTFTITGGSGTFSAQADLTARSDVRVTTLGTGIAGLYSIETGAVNLDSGDVLTFRMQHSTGLSPELDVSLRPWVMPE